MGRYRAAWRRRRPVVAAGDIGRLLGADRFLRWGKGDAGGMLPPATGGRVGSLGVGLGDLCQGRWAAPRFLPNRLQGAARIDGPHRQRHAADSCGSYTAWHRPSAATSGSLVQQQAKVARKGTEWIGASWLLVERSPWSPAPAAAWEGDGGGVGEPRGRPRRLRPERRAAARRLPVFGGHAGRDRGDRKPLCGRSRRRIG